MLPGLPFAPPAERSGRLPVVADPRGGKSIAEILCAVRGPPARAVGGGKLWRVAPATRFALAREAGSTATMSVDTESAADTTARHPNVADQHRAPTVTQVAAP